MFKFSLLALCALSMAAPALSAPVPNTLTMAEPKCPIPGHQRDGGCVVVMHALTGNNPGTQAVTFSTAPGKALAGKVKDYSIIYVYQTRKGGLNDTSDVMVNYGQQSMISDVPSTSPVLFWVVTHDGGRTFSKMTTTNPSSVIGG